VYCGVGFYICFRQFAIVTNDERENRKSAKCGRVFLNAVVLPAEIHRQTAGI
jgi:hypothetical protein